MFLSCAPVPSEITDVITDPQSCGSPLTVCTSSTHPFDTSPPSTDSPCCADDAPSVLNGISGTHRFLRPLSTAKPADVKRWRRAGPTVRCPCRSVSGFIVVKSSRTRPSSTTGMVEQRSPRHIVHFQTKQGFWEPLVLGHRYLRGFPRCQGLVHPVGSDS
jgi:hypothetical protein